MKSTSLVGRYAARLVRKSCVRSLWDRSWARGRSRHKAWGWRMAGGFCAHSSPSRSSPRSSTHCLASKNIIQHSRDQKSPSWRTRTTTNFNKVRWRLLLSTPNIYTTCIHTFHPNPSVSPRRPSWCILSSFVVTKLWLWDSEPNILSYFIQPKFVPKTSTSLLYRVITVLWQKTRVFVTKMFGLPVRIRRFCLAS